MADKSNETRDGSIAIVACETQSLSPREFDDLLDWLRRTKAVLEGNGTRKAKFEAVLELVRTHHGNQEVLRAFLKSVRRWLWDERSWSQRLAILGGSSAVLVVGGLTAGLATAGIGLAVPVAIVVAGGGSLVGNVIDVLERERKRAKENR